MVIFRWPMAIINFVVGFIVGFVDFFRNQWNQFYPNGQALFALAIILVAVDVVISFKFGWQQTEAHAFGFAGLAIAFFILPDAAVMEWRKGNRVGARGLWGATGLLFCVCLWTHFGYSSGVRLGDIQQDGYSKAAYVSAEAALKDKRATLAMKTEQHKTAKDKLDKALERNQGWTVSVDPTAMQAQLDELDRRIEAEKKGKRGRKAGCGGECEKLTDQRNSLSAAITVAKEENDLAASIATLEKEIEAKAEEVAALAPKSSAVAQQTAMAAKLVNVGAYMMGKASEEDVLKPSAFLQDLANTAASGVSSLALLLVGATLMMAAGFNRKPEFMASHEQATAPTPVGEQVGNRTPDQTRAYPLTPSPKISMHTRTIADLRRIAASA